MAVKSGIVFGYLRTKVSSWSSKRKTKGDHARAGMREIQWTVDYPISPSTCGHMQEKNVIILARAFMIHNCDNRNTHVVLVDPP